jgi:hypothetical protein
MYTCQAGLLLLLLLVVVVLLLELSAKMSQVYLGWYIKISKRFHEQDTDVTRLT